MSSLSLLAMPHDQAVRTMVQDKLIPGISVDNLVIETPVSVSGLQMASKLYISAIAHEDPSWPYFGDATFNYTALDMGDTFAGIPLAFAMPTTFTSAQLAARLGEALGIVFSPNDVVMETVTPTEMESEYELRASLSSPRWKGSVVIKIYVLSLGE